MLIKGLQKQTMLDYPGKIGCTIFLFGCNFKCPFCHNPELVDVKQAEQVKTYGEEEILQFLRKRRKFLEGVCITGGEPCLNADIEQFIKQIKALGYAVKLDTNGSNPELLKKLIEKKLIDYVAMDIKGTFEKYKKITGQDADIEIIKKSISIISKLKNYEFRITVVPGLVNLDDLIKIASYLKEKNANKAFFLQQFRPDKCLDKSFQKIKPFSIEQLKKFKKMLEPYFDVVGIRAESY